MPVPSAARPKMKPMARAVLPMMSSIVLSGVSLLLMWNGLVE